MVDQIIQYDEEMVGANHPSKSDTLNRALLIEHNADGTHKTGTYLAGVTFDVEHVASTGVHDPNKVLPTPTFLVEHNSDGTHKVAFIFIATVSLLDDATQTFATAENGWGFCMIGNNDEYAHFRFSNTGGLDIIINTDNVTDSDTDGNLCIYGSGTDIIIKNRLGAIKTLIYEKHAV